MKIFYNRILPFAFVFSLFSYSVYGETDTAVELWSIDTAGDAIQEEAVENQDDQDVNYEGDDESTISNELIETQSIQTQDRKAKFQSVVQESWPYSKILHSGQLCRRRSRRQLKMNVLMN